MTVYTADLPGGASARLGNIGRQVAQLPWFAKNLVIKVLLTLKLGRWLQRLTGRPPEWPY